MSYQRRLHVARLAADAALERKASEAVRALIEAPLRLVPMTAKAKEARVRIGKSNHGGDRRSRNFWRRGVEASL